MNVILIGMPGCGKSCMGRALSKKLNMKLIDTDRLIEAKTGKKLQEYIDENGIDGFRAVEEETLLSVVGDGLVISTGGSAVYYDAVMKHFKKLGAVVYLYVGVDIIKQRLGDFSRRGVVLKPGQTVDGLYAERTKLYEKYADIVVNCNGTDYQSYQASLIEALSNNSAQKMKKSSNKR